MDKVRYTLKKTDILRSRRIVSMLFSKRQPGIIERHSAVFGPLKAVYMFREEDETSTARLQAMFSVSKRMFKRAVHRNRMRRRMKEAYRLQKIPLGSLSVEKKTDVTIHFSFISNEQADYASIHESMRKILEKILDSLANSRH